MKRNGYMIKSSKHMLFSRRGFLGTSVISGIAIVNFGGFLWLENRFGIWRLTAGHMIDGLEKIYGKFPGYRRNHAKGVCISGYFFSTGQGATISHASVFRKGQYPVQGRFSFNGGNPHIFDSSQIVRGLGLKFDLPHDEQWRTAMVNIPVFPDKNAEEFYQRGLAFRADPHTGKPNPTTVQEYLALHSDTHKALEIISKTPSTVGFADSTFHSLHAFYAENALHQRTAIKWEFLPQQKAVKPVTSMYNPDCLFDALINQVQSSPLHWELYLIIGEDTDPITNPTQAWPDNRERIHAGTLIINHIESEKRGNAKDINFDPLVLPQGIYPSPDPLLHARSAAYAESYARRSAEPAPPCSVIVPTRNKM